MPGKILSESALDPRSRFFYGWVVVAACALMIGITYGLMFSYSVFFKPLADHFNWDRATVSLVYSASLIIRGAFGIVIGYLADRYGHIKVMVFCGFMTGLGLVLSSQVHSLLQLFLTYAVIEAIGLSGAFGIGTTAVSQWFTKNRGLALGIVSTGSGLGTMFIVPGNERLISAFGWSQAFFILGIIASIIMIASAFLLRKAPRPAVTKGVNPAPVGKTSTDSIAPQTELTLRQAFGNSKMLLLMASFLLFFFCFQMIMAHLVNYATDMNITPLVAATFISITSAVSIVGRLSAGVGSDRIGVHNTLILTSIFLIISFILLIFSKALWTFYLFAVLFGVTYGGEVTQIPLYISRYFGTKAMAALVGLSLFVANIGGALGPWMAGKIFDATQSYQWAFIAGSLAGLGSLILVMILKRQSQVTN